MELSKIRNFSIIAHIDHGKSTLADRMLELTGTIEKRKMREQVLDAMELERERGITIKMQPVRMRWQKGGQEYEFNLIDTPGHIDFSYEVSRSMKAVEGVILLVDATQGVQAQTLTVLAMAQEEKLTIIPVINKIDLQGARVTETREEIALLLNIDPNTILAVSGKTGEGVEALLDAVVLLVPSPRSEYPGNDSCRALVFDFEYSIHKGVIVYIRLSDGEIKTGEVLTFSETGEKFEVLETGTFSPGKTVSTKLEAGDIGYLVTGVKKTNETKVGDTITRVNKPLPAIPGYLPPRPVVWASIYPTSQDDFPLVRQALERLKLADAAISFEEETSGSLGRGFRCGFLGMLHLEIITERLSREFGLDLVVATPTISYKLYDLKTDTFQTIYSPQLFPEELRDLEVYEPWVLLKIITPSSYLGDIIRLLHDHESTAKTIENFGDDRTAVEIEMPLRELMRNFFDEVKSVSSGFASLSYQLLDERPADVAKLEVVINDEVVPAFTRVVSRRRAEREANETADKLKASLPRQLIVVKIQVRALGRIMAARSISALRKDVTGYLYGGDITRKMKLLEKQKRGKKKMQKSGKVNIPQEVFLKMMKGGQDK